MVVVGSRDLVRIEDVCEEVKQFLGREIGREGDKERDREMGIMEEEKKYMMK